MRGSRNTNDVCQPLVFLVPPSEWIDASNAPSCKVVLAPTLGPMLRSNAMNAPRGSLTPILVCWGNFDRSSSGITVFVVRFESVRREIAPISGRHNRVLIRVELMASYYKYNHGNSFLFLTLLALDYSPSDRPDCHKNSLRFTKIKFQEKK